MPTMFKLFVLLFVIKLYARNDIFKYVKKKHGQDITTVMQSLEKTQRKFMKVNADIKSIRKHGQDITAVIQWLEKTQRKFMKVNADIKYIKTCKKERVLLNRAPTSIQLHLAPSSSTQLHPPPPSSFQPPPSSLQHPQQYLNQIIARNWAISPNLGQKIKSGPF